MNARACIYAFVAVLLLSAYSADARTAADYFRTAPADALPLLRPNTRLDMLDYFNHGMANTSANIFGGEARIEEGSDRRLVASLSRDCSIEIAVVPVKGDTVVAFIETVLTPVACSTVTFYDNDWNKIEGLNEPTLSDFIPKKSIKGDMPEIFFAKATYDPSTNTFLFYNTTAGYYTDTDRPEWLKSMATVVKKRFDGRKFVSAK